VCLKISKTLNNEPKKIWTHIQEIYVVVLTDGIQLRNSKYRGIFHTGRPRIISQLLSVGVGCGDEQLSTMRPCSWRTSTSVQSKFICQRLQSLTHSSSPAVALTQTVRQARSQPFLGQIRRKKWSKQRCSRYKQFSYIFLI